MDNQSYYQQPMPGQMMGQPVSQQDAQGAQGAMGGMQPTAAVPTGAAKNTEKNMPWMVIAVVAGLVAITFVALFIWMYAKWHTAQTTVDGQIGAAVATAVNEKAEELERDFAEREKSPYMYFAGPADYGLLSFEYPKTWSVYEAKSANNGGDYEAYLNPGMVYETGSGTINALRVLVKTQAYDKFITQYDSLVKSGKLSVSVRPINGENANIYTGALPGTNGFEGIVAVFRIRDKTAVLQTDAMIFEEDFYRILETVQYNL